MAVNQFRVGLRRLTSHWKPLLLFELLWKVLTVLVIAPACAGLIQLAIRGVKLNYLTHIQPGEISPFARTFC